MTTIWRQEARNIPEGRERWCGHLVTVEEFTVDITGSELSVMRCLRDRVESKPREPLCDTPTPLITPSQADALITMWQPTCIEDSEDASTHRWRRILHCLTRSRTGVASHRARRLSRFALMRLNGPDDRFA